MKKLTLLLCLLLCTAPEPSKAADPFAPDTELAEDTPAPVLKPRHTRADPLAKVPTRLRPQALVWAQTPLVYEDIFERRFNTFGGGVGIDFGETKLGAFLVRCEIGARVSWAVLELSLPALSFTHLYFDIPVLFRLELPLSKSERWLAEFFAGAHVRAFEYDSRPTTDGGFSKNLSSSVLKPEGGIGLTYWVSSGMALKVRAGYLFLSAGAAFPL